VKGDGGDQQQIHKTYPRAENGAAAGTGGQGMSGSREETVVRVSRLSRHFKRKRALDGVDLTVRKGTVHGLVGQNGAGKTTLIKHLLGTLRAEQGSVEVFGKDPTREFVGVLSQVGYLSEDRDLPGWMRVRELMRYTQAFYPTWDEAYAEQLRERFKLDAETRIKQLSRGEKAKVGLLCALAYRPPLLLLDEPSTGLDVGARRDILGAIVRTVADEGRTVIFSSHLLDEVERVADVITMIHDGRVVVDGPLDDIKGAHKTLQLEFDEPREALDSLPGLLHADGHGREWRAVVEAHHDAFKNGAFEAMGGRVVETQTPSLEEIFLARVGHVPADAEE
jgi:ABC-2 type transport system ATP-binding protein